MISNLSGKFHTQKTFLYVEKFFICIFFRASSVYLIIQSAESSFAFLSSEIEASVASALIGAFEASMKVAEKISEPSLLSKNLSGARGYQGFPSHVIQDPDFLFQIGFFSKFSSI